MALESRNFQLECLATGRQPSCGLSPAVLATLQEARAPSIRALYAGCWERFSQWCATTGLSPVSYGTQGVLLFLQSLLEGGLSESTLRGYVAAISDRHIPIEGRSVGSQPLICQFLTGARRIRPSRSPMVPSWDLQLVLRALSGSPFEPLSKLGLELLSFKTAFLLAMASAKRVSELHALSVHPSCLRLGEEGSAISLLPNPAFLPKVLPRSFVVRPLVLEPFHPPPHDTVEAARLHLLCPVRSLRMYVARTASVRQTDRLFVCYGGAGLGRALSKQRLARWVVQAIARAYDSAGVPPPEGVVAHSTRGMSTSWALFRGAPLEDVCAAAGWASPATFARLYRLNVGSSVASAFLQAGQ